uniref:SGL domain-containing protein n=1 Tax=Echinococcus granulosus TaxID=6210 RepID=A0A068WY66_ECHGR|nr:hypothetical protein EgrG_001112900.3 [Echinococcus granulosus]
MLVIGHCRIQIVGAVPGIAADANVDPRGRDILWVVWPQRRLQL